jgi:hypothetical protein
MTSHSNRPTGVMKKPAIFADRSLMRLSKAALADIAWNLAARCAESCDDRDAVLSVVMEEAETVSIHRGDRIPKVQP